MTEADDERFAKMLAEALADKRCPCGSGQYAYNLYDTKGQLVLYGCHSCEKRRRTTGSAAQ